MTTRKLFALSLAATLLSAPLAVTASAATNTSTHHATTPRHRTVKPVRSSNRSAARAAPNADHSADSLNAQSLNNARSGQ